MSLHPLWMFILLPVVMAYLIATHGAIMLLRCLLRWARKQWMRLSPAWIAMLGPEVARQVKTTSTAVAVGLSMTQLLAFALMAYYFKHPASIYETALCYLAYVLFTGTLVLAILFRHLPLDRLFSRTPYKWLAATILGLFVYLGHCQASEWLSTVFPFSSSNIRLAFTAAWVMETSRFFSLLGMLTALGFEVAVALPISLDAYLRKENLQGLPLTILLGMTFISVYMLSILLENTARTHLGTLLVSKIAMDYDSLPPEPCVAKEDVVQKSEQGRYRLRLIPVSTSVEKAYLVKQTVSLPNVDELKQYHRITVTPYLPRVIGFVDCSTARY